MILQLNPPLWLITPKGKGICHLVIDMGFDADLLWVVFDKATRTVWTWRNCDILADINVTMGFHE